MRLVVALIVHLRKPYSQYNNEKLTVITRFVHDFFLQAAHCQQNL